MAQNNLLASVVSTAVLLALTAGCASLTTAKSMFGTDASVKRRQRNEEVIRNFEAHRDQAAYEAALAHWEQNDSKGCREGLERLLARDPNHCDAQLLLAEVNLLEKRPQDALKQVDGVLGSKPGNARALYTKGLVLDAIGQSAGALSYYEQAAKAEPENEIYALCYQNAKDSDGSREALSDAPIPAAYTAASDTDKNISPAKNNQGPALTTPANKLMPVVTPSAPSRTSNTADNTEKTGGLNDSYAHAESAVSAEEFLREGQRAISDGANDPARIAFHRAVACQPNNPQIPIVSAGAALRTNHPELAVELLTPAARRFSKSAAIYRMLGAAYYRLGDYQSSQVALQQALSLDTNRVHYPIF